MRRDFYDVSHVAVAGSSALPSHQGVRFYGMFDLP